MSRRQHVVRTDDKAGVGTARSLGSCRIFCASENHNPVPTLTANAGTLAQGDEMLIAPITVTSTRDYQRCLVSAAVGRVGAYIPDPPIVGASSHNATMPVYEPMVSPPSPMMGTMAQPELDIFGLPTPDRGTSFSVDLQRRPAQGAWETLHSYEVAADEMSASGWNRVESLLPEDLAGYSIRFAIDPKGTKLVGATVTLRPYANGPVARSYGWVRRLGSMTFLERPVGGDTEVYNAELYPGHPASLSTSTATGMTGVKISASWEYYDYFLSYGWATGREAVRLQAKSGDAWVDLAEVRLASAGSYLVPPNNIDSRVVVYGEATAPDVSPGTEVRFLFVEFDLANRPSPFVEVRYNESEMLEVAGGGEE